MLGGVRIGLTMLLYRAPEHRRLEERRHAAIAGSVIRISSFLRGGLARRIKLRLSAARRGLAAALDAMELVRLDDAITI